MARPDRRKLLTGASALLGLSAIPPSGSGALDPADKFDLLVRNANVLDPSQGLSGKRDIGIRYASHSIAANAGNDPNTLPAFHAMAKALMKN